MHGAIGGKSSENPFIQALRSIETETGTGDGLALLAGKDVSFATKIGIWKNHIAPIAEYLKEQDLAPPEDAPEEEPPEEAEPEEDESAEAPDDGLPPPADDSLEPSMDEMEKGKEGEPKAHFTLAPFYGGYHRQQVYSRWNAKGLKWEKMPSKETVQTEEKLEDLSVRNLSGSVCGRQRIALPLPDGWAVSSDTLVTNAPPESVHLTRDENGSAYLKIEADGIFSYRIRNGKRSARRELMPPPVREDREIEAKLSKGAEDLAIETKGGKLSAAGKARLLLKSVRERLEYSNDSALSAEYRRSGADFFRRIWETKKADCDVANTVAAAVLRKAGIPCRLGAGHYIKTKSHGDKALMTSGTSHAWLYVWDEDARSWFRGDATPKGDPTMDEERPDEQQESGEGDYGEQEAEIMSDEQLEELIKKLEEAEGTPPEKTSNDRETEKFAEQAECSKEEALEVLEAFRRLRELKDAKGERIGQKLVKEWKNLVHSRMVKKRVYEGPVPMSEGDELEDVAMAKIDIRSGEKNPMGFEKIATIEKREKLFGGLDVYLLLDASGSMSEVDSKTGRSKSELQRDFSMLYVDSLMQCAFLSRQAEGRLRAPLPIRAQVVSIHGNVSVDLPLVDSWGPKEKVGLYRAVMRTATNSTPDHAGLMAIEQTIMAEREAWKKKTHRAEEKPPLEFVVTTLDGGSDNPTAVQGALGRMREKGIVDFAYGMTAAAKPIEYIYAPNAKVTEDLASLPELVSKDTLAVFKKLYPERIRRGK
ncbi:hypothetical protein KKD42_02190 [Patescibacteria group bacterium]|nr:hypothetical protein [Patescibacteria group bacterium]